MRIICTLALLAGGAVSINGTCLRAADAGGRIELSFSKSFADQSHLDYDTTNLAEMTSGKVDQREDLPFPDEVGGQLEPRVRPEAGVQPVTIDAPKIELMAPKPNNVVRSKRHPGIEYSGILVQLAGNNPLQLVNPWAPTRYGDGEANTLRNVITRRPEGLKLLSIGF